MHYLILIILGLLVGILSGFLGIGGGTVLVPLLVSIGYSPIQAAAMSSLAVVITATSGSIQNLRMGKFSFRQVASLGFPALIMSQLGVYLAHQMDSHLLLITFDMFLLLNIYLVELRKRLTQKQKNAPEQNIFDVIARIKDSKTEILIAGWMTLLGGLIILLELIILDQPIQANFKLFSSIITITPLEVILFGILILLFGFLLDLPKLLILAKKRYYQFTRHLNGISRHLNGISWEEDVFLINHIQSHELLGSDKKNEAEEIIDAFIKSGSPIFRNRFNAFILYVLDAKSEIIIAGLSVFITGIITWLKLFLSDQPLEALVHTAFGSFTLTPIQVILLGASLLFVVHALEFIQHLTSLEVQQKQKPNKFQSTIFKILTGGVAGLLSGLFGIGGGVILVPLQLLLLNETIKTAIRTSLGVIVITSISSFIGHALSGNLFFVEGLMIGMGGLIGAQISSGFLPKLSEQFVSISFRIMLSSLFVYTAFLAVSTGNP
jgi:uncharacterized protein